MGTVRSLSNNVQINLASYFPSILILCSHTSVPRLKAILLWYRYRLLHPRRWDSLWYHGILFYLGEITFICGHIDVLVSHIIQTFHYIVQNIRYSLSRYVMNVSYNGLKAACGEKTSVLTMSCSNTGDADDLGVGCMGWCSNLLHRLTISRNESLYLCTKRSSVL